MFRICIFSNHPAPYRDKIYEDLASKYNSEFEIDVVQYYGFDRGHSYQSISNIKYVREVILRHDTLNMKRLDLFIRCKNEVDSILKRNQYDLVFIPGYGRAPGLAATMYCIRNKIPYILSTDEIELKHKSIIRRSIKKLLASFFYNQSRGVFVPGKASLKYVSQYIKNQQRCPIKEGTYCYDNKQMLLLADEARTRREINRLHLGFDEDDVVFIYAGRLIEVRDVLSLIKAFGKLERQKYKTKLLIIGNGPEENKLKSYVQMENMRNVVFHDFVPNDEICSFYTACDVAILTSIIEHYSMALVQAALCSMPIVSTRSVGAVQDIVDEGVNGYLAIAKDVESIEQCMINMMKRRDEFPEMGRHSLDMVLPRDLDWSVGNLHYLIVQALGVE